VPSGTVLGSNPGERTYKGFAYLFPSFLVPPLYFPLCTSPHTVEESAAIPEKNNLTTQPISDKIISDLPRLMPFCPCLSRPLSNIQLRRCEMSGQITRASASTTRRLQRSLNPYPYFLKPRPSSSLIEPKNTKRASTTCAPLLSYCTRPSSSSRYVPTTSGRRYFNKKATRKRRSGRQCVAPLINKEVYSSCNAECKEVRGTDRKGNHRIVQERGY
jgi:hypothetical protein